MHMQGDDNGEDFCYYDQNGEDFCDNNVGQSTLHKGLHNTSKKALYVYVTFVCLSDGIFVFFCVFMLLFYK